MCKDAAFLRIFPVKSTGIRNDNMSFLKFLDICFFNLLYWGLTGRTLLGSLWLWLVWNYLCSATSAEWGPEFAWDPWMCWRPHCAHIDKCVVKGHQKLQKLIIEMDNPENPVTLPSPRASSDASIRSRSVMKLWLSHTYPEPCLHLEKEDYFAIWQPYCLWQLTPWSVCLGSHILNN